MNSSPSYYIQSGGKMQNPKRSRAPLTPTQLERKRAHDRAAQRVSRKRVKEYIAWLEAEIEQKRYTGTSLELARQNQALEEENTYLRHLFVTNSHENTWCEPISQGIECTNCGNAAPAFYFPDILDTKTPPPHLETQQPILGLKNDPDKSLVEHKAHHMYETTMKEADRFEKGYLIPTCGIDVCATEAWQ